MASKLQLFLIGSLAVNAALLGVVGGRVIGGTKQQPASVQMQLDRYGPTSDVVAAAWAQLPDDDRKVLRQQFRERWKTMEGERQRLQEAGKIVYEAALAEPFDEGKLRDAVTIFQMREQRMQQSAEDILISHLGKMPPQARATAAVGLLTPFNARVQRADDADRPAGAPKEGRAPRGPIAPPALMTPGDAVIAPDPAQPGN